MLHRQVRTYVMEERTFFIKRNRKLDAISKSWVFCFFKIQVGPVWESLWVEDCPLSFYTPLLGTKKSPRLRSRYEITRAACRGWEVSTASCRLAVDFRNKWRQISRGKYGKLAAANPWRQAALEITMQQLPVISGKVSRLYSIIP